MRLQSTAQPRPRASDSRGHKHWRMRLRSVASFSERPIIATRRALGRSCAVLPRTHMMVTLTEEETNMTKKILSLALSIALTGLATLFTPLASRADNKDTDEDRLRNSGQVLKEILDIPDDIPQSLLDKADCVIVLPTVLKFA